MAVPGDAKALGRRVALHRSRRGLSQKELGGRISRSESWVSQVERGARRVDRMSVLEMLADALEVPLAELAPEENVVAAVTGKPRAASSLSLALSSSDALQAVLSDKAPIDVDRLGERAERAWDYAHGSEYESLSDLLGTLIPELEYAVRKATGADRQRVCIAKAKAYHAAAGVLSKLGELGAAWVAVDRSIAAAEEADDPLLMAAGAFRLAIVFQNARRHDLAMQAAKTAVNALGRLVDAGEPEAVALRGALYLQLAVASARTNQADDAYDYLTKAQEAAKSLGVDRNDYNTEFGPTNVLLHEVHVAVELGDAGRALRVADKADTKALSAERQSRLLIDVARAHAQRRQATDLTIALRRAFEVAPEQVATHQVVQELLSDALRSDYGNTPELRELAQEIGVAT
ncbi:helix-turn-helix domain-containing protein [Amycolatopsis magusensis]|uniref:helix-turn-helix domain-containing protein n=1 Tax=Amycolatopsis magusensis TaxID=882444 RepID=UPI0024A8E9E4|nr:helix-turn-helix transcriptional regulator [Amycolatopsis magusensis]MDI5979607.1 helix-turn-helix transcriptional regulator [Amycolatopsis magusensis]